MNSNRGIRIIELPSCVMLTSKGSSIEEFDVYWSVLDKKRTDKFYPRDFMYYDDKDKELVWLYACEEKYLSDEKFESIHFDGGLYAACISKDGDDGDGESVYNEIKKWVTESGVFQLDENNGRHTVFHIVTTDSAYAKLGYRQLDIYVPIC